MHWLGRDYKELYKCLGYGLNTKIVIENERRRRISRNESKIKFKISECINVFVDATERDDNLTRINIFSYRDGRITNHLETLSIIAMRKIHHRLTESDLAVLLSKI